MKIVDRYIGRSVIGATLAVLMVLLAIFTFFAFIDELEDIGRGAYTIGLALWVVVLSLPGLAYELFPIAALIGALLGLGSLAERNEIVVVRCAGVSKRRVMWSVMKAGSLFVLSAMLIGELVFPLAERESRALRAGAIAERAAGMRAADFWAREGNDFVNIGEVLPGGRFNDIVIHEFDDMRRLQRSAVARSARYADGAWILHDVDETRFVDEVPYAAHRQRARWDSALDPALIGMTALEPETLSVAELARYVEFARANGQDAQRWEYALWGKIAYPLATAVMVYLAVPLVLRSSRHVATGRRVLIGAVIGLGFHVVNQASGHVGVVFGISAAASALLPTACLFLLGAVMNHRLQ